MAHKFWIIPICFYVQHVSTVLQWVGWYGIASDHQTIARLSPDDQDLSSHVGLYLGMAQNDQPQVMGPGSLIQNDHGDASGSQRYQNIRIFGIPKMASKWPRSLCTWAIWLDDHPSREDGEHFLGASIPGHGETGSRNRDPTSGGHEAPWQTLGLDSYAP